MAGLLRCDFCKNVVDSDKVKREPRILALWEKIGMNLKIEVLKPAEEGTEVPDVCDDCMNDVEEKIRRAFEPKEG